MDFEIFITEALLLVEIIILIFLAIHTIKLENYNKSLFEHLEKLDEHLDILDEHIDKLDGHVDKLDEHSQVMDYHLKTILDHSRIRSMDDEEREEFVEGIEEYLKERVEKRKNTK